MFRPARVTMCLYQHSVCRFSPNLWTLCQSLTYGREGDNFSVFRDIVDIIVKTNNQCIYLINRLTLTLTAILDSGWVPGQLFTLPLCPTLDDSSSTASPPVFPAFYCTRGSRARPRLSIPHPCLAHTCPMGLTIRR